MKTHSSRLSRGFTLIELLVVVAIIAVLASFGTAAGLNAIQKAKATSALNTAMSVQTAVNQFYSEYSSMPVADLSADTTVVTDGRGLDLLKALLGTETIAAPLNSRSIKFLNTGDGKNNKDGLIYADGVVKGLYDPWGGPYHVILDGDYDEVITAKTTAGITTLTLNGRRAAVFSDGPDFASGPSGKPANDVKTWK